MNLRTCLAALLLAAGCGGKVLEELRCDASAPTVPDATDVAPPVDGKRCSVPAEAPGCHAEPDAAFEPGSCPADRPAQVGCSPSAKVPAGCSVWNATPSGYNLCCEREVCR